MVNLKEISVRLINVKAKALFISLLFFSCAQETRNFEIFVLSPDKEKVVELEDRVFKIKGLFYFQKGSVEEETEILVGMGNEDKRVPPYITFPFYIHVQVKKGSQSNFKRDVRVRLDFPEESTFPSIITGFLWAVASGDTSSGIVGFIPSRKENLSQEFSLSFEGTYIPAFFSPSTSLKSFAGEIKPCENGGVFTGNNGIFFLHNYPFSVSTKGVFILGDEGEKGEFPCGTTQKLNFLLAQPVSFPYPSLIFFKDSVNSFWYPEDISDQILYEISFTIQKMIESGLIFFSFSGPMSSPCYSLGTNPFPLGVLNFFYSGGVLRIFIPLIEGFKECAPQYGPLMDLTEELITLFKNNLTSSVPQGFECSDSRECFYENDVCASQNVNMSEYARGITCSRCLCSCNFNWCDVSIPFDFPLK